MFMMPMFRIMMIGSVVKSLMEKSNLSKQKVGFTTDFSTASTIVLLPAYFLYWIHDLTCGGSFKGISSIYRLIKFFCTVFNLASVCHTESTPPTMI
jgi:hypothetical protein